MSELSKYSVLFSIDVNTKNASQSLKNIEGQTKKASKGFTGLAKKAALAFKAFIAVKAVQQVGRLAGAMVKAAGSAESLRQSFTTLTGSAETATVLLKELAEFANETPFSNEDIELAAKSLLSYGIAAKDVAAATKQVGELAAATGAPISSLAEAYGKANARFKVTNETLELFANNGVDILGLFADKLGLSRQEIIKMASQGKISFTELKEVIAEATGEGGKFQGALERQSQTINGLLSTIQGKFQNTFKIFSERFGPVIKFVLSGINDLVDAVGGWVDSLDVELGIKAVATFKGLGAVVDVFLNNVRIGFQSLDIVFETAAQAIVARLKNLTNPALGQSIVSALYKGQSVALDELSTQIEEYGAAYNGIYGHTLQTLRANQREASNFKITQDSITDAVKGTGDELERIATITANSILGYDIALIQSTTREVDNLSASLRALADAAQDDPEGQLQRQERMEAERDAMKSARQEAVEDAIAKTVNLTDTILNDQIRRADGEIQIQRDKITFLSGLNETATDEQLKLEQDRLEKLTIEREKAAQTQRRISAIQVAAANAVAVAEGIKNIAASFSPEKGGIIGGIATSIALAATIATTIAGLANAFNSAPAFFEGVESTGRGSLDNKGGFAAVLHPGERVVPKKHNDLLGGIKNEELPRLVRLGKLTEKRYKINNDVISDGNDKSLKELKSLRQEIKELKNVMAKGRTSIRLDSDGFSASVLGYQERERKKDRLR